LRVRFERFQWFAAPFPIIRNSQGGVSHFCHGGARKLLIWGFG
jgi:hypothetical protein